MTQAAAIPAAYVKLATMADGTVRVVLDVPRDYFAHVSAMLDKPGVPVALARLAPDTPDEPQASPAPPVSSPEPQNDRTSTWTDLKLSVQAGILCADPKFRRFLHEHVTPVDWIADSTQTVEQIARDIVVWHCGVKSRAELPHNNLAAQKWQELVADYREWERGPAFS